MPRRHSFVSDNFTYVHRGSSGRSGVRPPVADVRSQAALDSLRYGLRSQAVASGSLRYGLIPQAAALGIGWQVHSALVHH